MQRSKAISQKEKIMRRIKVINPIFYKPCSTCENEYKKEKMFKASIFYESPTSIGICLNYIFYGCCNCFGSKDKFCDFLMKVVNNEKE